VIVHGIDIAHIKRIRELSEHQTFLERVFTKGEIAYSFAKPEPHKHLAGRFAVKEAVMKALGTGWAKGVAWTDIEVISWSDKSPVVHLKDEAARLASGKRIHISIAYSSGLAFAAAVIESL